MVYRLGLDLGTASVGAAAFSLNENQQPDKLIWHRVHLFDEPNEKGTTGGRTPKKAARRDARLQRRQTDRRASRLRRIAHLAPLLGLNADQIPKDSGQQIHRIRANATEEKITLEDLFRICLKLAKRRGYKGQFRVKASDGEVKSGVEQIKKIMDEGGHKTVGQYLYDRSLRGLPIKLKVQNIASAKKRNEIIQNNPEDYNLYITRDMLEIEFNLIWDKQAEFYPQLSGANRGESIKSHFYKAIFYQRPLKSPAPMVGNCSLETNLPRAPLAQMAFQAFRIEKQISDLRWGMRKKSEGLNPDQKTYLRNLLHDPSKLTKEGKLSFKKIYDELKKANIYFPAQNLNMDRQTRGGREELQGNRTLKVFATLDLLEEWQALTKNHQITIINFLSDLGSPEQLDDDEWHNKIQGSGKSNKAKLRKFDNKVIEFIDQLRSHEKFSRLSGMGFDNGRANYCIKALNQLTEWLISPFWNEKPETDSLPRVDEEAAITQCYSKPRQTEKTTEKLESPPLTGSAVVDVALRQIKYVVNQCIEQYGAPQQIVIEFSREMGKSLSQRGEIEKRGQQNNRAREQAKKEIEKLGFTPSNNLIRRYLLWQEQDSRCPYCTNKIVVQQAMHGGETHYEHILPRSLTQIGLKRSEIVLSHKHCNDLKGNQTPYEAFHSSDPQRWAAVEELAKHFKQKKLFRKANLLLIKDYQDDISLSDFCDRQLQQTSWISKAVGKWMRTFCNDVHISRGELTARLRHIWQLDTVIPDIRIEEGYPILDTDDQIIPLEEYQTGKRQWQGQTLPPGVPRINRTLNKRCDHRHHLIDAITIAMVSRSLYVNMATQYKKDQLALEEYNKLSPDSQNKREEPQPKWSIEPPLKTLREQSLEVIRNCNITRKPDRYSTGALFKDTAYSTFTDETANKTYLALRCDIADLVDEKSYEKTKKNLQTIISPGIRKIVSTAIENGFNNKENLQQTLNHIEHPQYSQPEKPVYIRKVKCNRKYDIDTAEPIRFGKQKQHIKYLQDAGNAFLEVVFNSEQSKVIDSRLVTMAQANRNLTPLGPSTKKYFKGDTLLNKANDRRYIIKQIKSASDGTLFLVPIIETRPVSELDKKENAGILLRANVKKLPQFINLSEHG